MRRSLHYIATSIATSVLLVATPAIAHVGIAATVPVHDAVIERAPELLRFVFPGQVTITNVRVLPVDERLVQVGDTINVRLPRNRIGQSTAFGDAIDLAIPLLPPGTYQVVFQATSIEGHAMADDFTFTIKP